MRYGKQAYALLSYHVLSYNHILQYQHGVANTMMWYITYGIYAYIVFGTRSYMRCMRYFTIYKLRVVSKPIYGID